MANIRIFISVPLVLALSGCAALNDNLGKVGGVTIGSAGGAAIGKQIDGKRGMVVGSIIGGAIGYFIGDYIDQRRAEQKKISQEYGVHTASEDVKAGDKKGDRLSVATDDNQFAVGKSSLNPRANEYFTKIAQTYKNSGRKILVVGHTDDSGSSATNQKLSEERAKTVGKIFAANGTAKQNIYYWGAGESQPIADNNKADGRMKNRRVEIIELESEADIIKYTQGIKVDPSYFTRLQQPSATFSGKGAPKLARDSKHSGKLASDSVSTKANSTSNSLGQERNSDKPKGEKIASAKIQSGTENQGDKISKHDEISTQGVKTTENTKPSKNIVGSGNAVVDFGGEPAHGQAFMLASEYGGEKQGFSFITKAYASDGFMSSCAFDEYHADGAVKALASGKELPKTTEFKKALNGGVWSATLNDNLVALAPVSVLAQDGKASANPKIYIYKGYIRGSNSKADYQIQGRVNTYEGEKGLLYRVFASDKNSPLKCVDIVFDDKNVARSKGYLYYSLSNGALLEKGFEIKPLSRK